MLKYTDDYWKDVREVLACVPHVERLFNKSILITGATGMIGSSVAELLFELNRSESANIKIYLAGRSLQRMQQRFYCFMEGVDYFYVEYDATAGSALTTPSDFIIHGASPADPSAIASYPVETMMANLLGLRNLLELVRQTENGRLLFISSSEVYGKKADNQPYEESDYGFLDILNPRASYPSSKRAAETLCASYLSEYSVDFVVVRPGHIYGPSITQTDSRASAQFTRKSASGENIIMKSAGTQLRSYTYTLDCASAILTVLINGIKGEAYNISNSDSIVSIRKMAECLAQASGLSLVFEQASMQESNSYNLMSNSSLNSRKIENLGWHGCFNLEHGITATLKYYG